MLGKPVKQKVSAFIQTHQLLRPEALHLVALSGGADSVALLLILLQMGYRVEAVHCNFHLRGSESDRDEAFVKTLCDTKGVPIHLIHFDTKAYAALHQVSIEMAARELRYRYFEQLRQDISAETVCVAHHQDDAVETLLMNLFRGAGIHGLTGIRPQNGHIVRPLLCVRRQEIETFLESLGQDYVTDSTNLEPDVLRNEVRLLLVKHLKQLKQVKQGALDNIARTAQYLSEAEKVYNAQIQSELALLESDLASQADALKTLPSGSRVYQKGRILSAASPLCLLHELLTPLGFNRAQVGEILAHLNDESGVPGKSFDSATHTLVIDRETLVVAPLLTPIKPTKIPEPGTYRTDETTLWRFELLEGAEVSKDPQVATLDAVDIRFPLTLRQIQPGDRFQPFGMQGQKLVSDFLTDRKMNLIEKNCQQVITDATGNILWLVGLRIDHRYRVKPSTRQTLRITRTR